MQMIEHNPTELFPQYRLLDPKWKLEIEAMAAG